MGKRYNNLAIYRIFAALAIILFHIFFIAYDRDIPFETLLSKAVQGLTALSGFLYAKKKIPDTRNFLLTSAKKLAIPAVICVLFMAIWNLVYLISTGATDYIALFFDKREYNGSLLIQPGNYYYLLFIFICYAITPLIKDEKTRKRTVTLAVTIELLLSFAFGLSIIVIPYIVGYLVGESGFEEYTSPKYTLRPILVWLIATILSTAAYAALVIFPFGATSKILNIFALLTNITSAAVGTSSFFLIIYLLKPLNSFDEPPILRYTDRLGLIIFLMNQAFLCGAMDLTVYFADPALDMLLVFAATILSSALIDWLITLSGRILERRTV